MMSYIDLLDDSDDDIPLLPSKTISSSAKTIDDKLISTHHSACKEDNIVELLSSDDDVPVLRHSGGNYRPYIRNKTPLSVAAHDNDSDKTEKYSDSTEKYGFSSDLESLPDINAGAPLPSHTAIIGTSVNNKPSASIAFSSQSNDLKEQHRPQTEFTHIKNKKPLSAKAAEKAAERDRIRQEKLLAQEQKREEKERKALEKKRDVAMRDAEREARRAAQPGECHRHMLLEVDKQLEATTLGVCVEAICVANCVPLKFKDTPVNNALLFKRKLVSPESGTTSYILEDNMAIVLPMLDMVELIKSGLSGSHITLDSYIKTARRKCNSKPTIMVIGCEKYFRTLKTQNNRVYKDNVLGTQSNSRKNKDIPVITRLQYEEAITALQMTSDIVIINHEVEEDVAKTLLRLNKSIAEVPIKRSKYEQQALSVKTSGLKIGKNKEGCLKVWQRMLQEFKNISADVSNSIVAEWPSPYLLFLKYEKCANSTEAELLLQDIQVRRGGGVVQTTRRVGKETSRRIYELFNKHADYIIK